MGYLKKIRILHVVKPSLTHKPKHGTAQYVIKNAKLQLVGDNNACKPTAPWRRKENKQK